MSAGYSVLSKFEHTLDFNRSILKIEIKKKKKLFHFIADVQWIDSLIVMGFFEMVLGGRRGQLGRCIAHSSINDFETKLKNRFVLLLMLRPIERDWIVSSCFARDSIFYVSMHAMQ